MSNQQNCILLGVPLDSGKRRRGCLMGPDAYRVAGLTEALEGAPGGTAASIACDALAMVAVPSA